VPVNDSAFKWLMSFQPQQFVDRFCPGAQFVKMLPTELPRDPQRADTLAQVHFPKTKSDPGDYGLHLEAQTKADSTMPRRMCTYGLLAEERDKLIVLSTAIYLEKCKTPTPPWRQLGPGGRVIRVFDYGVVRLWEEPVDDWLAAGQVGLLPFVPFLKGATISSLEPVAAALGQIPDPLERANSIYYTVAFAERVFTPAVVNSFLRRSKVLDAYLKESPLYQEILEKGLAEGMSQGMAQGMAEGMAEGISQGEVKALHNAILRIVRKRFSPLFAVAEAHLSTIANLPKLQEILDELPYAPDEAAAKQILGLSA
jgi:predicted transposase YdaD